MSITFISPKKALNTAFYKLPVLESDIQKLSNNLKIYIQSAKDGESEEYHKGLIKDFFANTFLKPIRTAKRCRNVFIIFYRKILNSATMR